MTKQQEAHGRILDLERQVDGLASIVESVIRESDNRISRNPTLGITAKKEGQTYPTEAEKPNVYPFKFLDSTFKEVAGKQERD